ncbi:MAG: NERD domain-containing protein [Deltaproteobacteria bacterium]|nr:NERD domain-containing protein [Deltaproteobacteria bacterium]
MDFSPIMNQFIRNFWFLIPIGVIAIILKTPWFKGIIGEFIVNLGAQLMLNKNQYHLIKNVTLPTDAGTTQIDHIIVSPYGIFVVETKNMKGWIFGSANQKIWTQKIYKHTSKFQNPLHQNYKHVKTLESLLGLKEHQIHSVIVFVGNSTFKTDMPENVTYGAGYIRYIKSKKQCVLNESEVREIKEKIESGQLSKSLKTHREHVKHVKNIIAEKENNKTPICPKCVSSMVLRKTKKGPNAGKEFWGCKKFPHCRGIVNIT